MRAIDHPPIVFASIEIIALMPEMTLACVQNAIDTGNFRRDAVLRCRSKSARSQLANAADGQRHELPRVPAAEGCRIGLPGTKRAEFVDGAAGVAASTIGVMVRLACLGARLTS
jgi:hypothetical protein